LSKVRLAAILSSLSLYVNQFFTVAFTMYISRVFTPEQLGIYSLSLSIVALGEATKSMGTGEYLIREKEITPAMVKSTLGLTVIISWVTGLILVSCAEPISLFYEQENIEYMIYILSITFFISPYISVNSALLTKQLSFTKKIFMEWANVIVTMASTLIIFYYIGNHFALVYGVISGVIIQLLLSIKLKAVDMCFIPQFKNMSSQLKFGAITTLSSLIERLSVIAPDLIIGKLGSVKEVAFMSKGLSAIQLSSHMLISGAKPVALPYLSNAENNEKQYAYIKATNLTHALCLPVLLALVFSGELLIQVLFGDQWQKAGELVQYLAVLGFFFNLHPFHRALLISMNMEKWFLLKQVVSSLLTITMIFIGYQWKLEGVAISLAACSVVIFMINHSLVAKALNVNSFGLLKSIFNPIFLSIICLLISWSVMKLMNFYIGNLYVQFIAYGVAMAFGWLIFASMLKLDIIQELIKLTKVKDILRKFTEK